MSLFLRRLLDWGRHLFRRAQTQPHKPRNPVFSRWRQLVRASGGGPVRSLNEAEFSDFMAELERCPRGSLLPGNDRP